MRGAKLELETIEAVWTILVEDGDADERGRDAFVNSVIIDGLSEYRFRGLLGMGGKVRARKESGDTIKLYVDYYEEDASAVRDATKALLNARLEALAQGREFLPTVDATQPRRRPSTLAEAR